MSFIQVIIEPQSYTKDVGSSRETERAMSHNENDAFCDDIKPIDDSYNENTEFDVAQDDETMDNDSDPSFKSGSDHAVSSEYSFQLFEKSRFLCDNV